MDRNIFFASVRASALYRTGLPQPAVDALDAMLDAGTALTNAELAYCMATAYHEVGANLLPVRESLNYSASGLLKNFSRARISAADANRLGRKPGEGPLSLQRQQAIANLIYGGEWGRKNLGNTLAGDGWRFRGGGLPQTTGRVNYRKVGTAVGVDLEAYPDRIMEQRIAIHALIEAMRAGIYTGKKLTDYRLPAQFAAARAIINNDVKKNGEKIAGHARLFLAALDASGRKKGDAAPQPKPAPVPQPAPVPAPAPPQQAGEAPPAAGSGSKGKWAAGTAAAVLVALAAAWEWVANLPCHYLNLFCGS